MTAIRSDIAFRAGDQGALAFVVATTNKRSTHVTVIGVPGVAGAIMVLVTDEATYVGIVRPAPPEDVVDLSCIEPICKSGKECWIVLYYSVEDRLHGATNAHGSGICTLGRRAFSLRIPRIHVERLRKC